MGRYYSTSSPQQLDYMFKLPEELMLKATQQASQDITENQTALYSLLDKLQLPAISMDKERAQQIVSGYEDKINGMAQQLQKDPIAFRRKTGDIIGLAREVHKDWTQGEASGIAARYQGYLADKETMKKMVESGKINGAEVDAMLRHSLSHQDKYEYNANTGEATPWRSEILSPFVDVPKKFIEIGEKLKPHIRAYSGVDPAYKGMYIYENEGKTAILSKSEIEHLFYQQLIGDTEVQNYLIQRGKIGTISGFTTTDDQGNTRLIDPWGVIGTQKDKKTGKTSNVYGFNTSTKLGSMLSGIADMFDVNDVLESKQHLSVNSHYEKMWTDSLGATPDTHTTSFNVNSLPDNVQDIHGGRNSIENTIYGLRNYVQQGMVNLNSTQQKQVQAQLDKAIEEAKNGDITNLSKLYMTYAPAYDGQGRETRSAANLSTVSNFNNAYVKQINSEAQYKALVNLAVSKNPSLKNADGSVNQAAADAVVQKWLNETKYTTKNVDMWATSGNNDALFSTPELKAQAIAAIAPMAKVASDPTNWGSSFYFVAPKVNDKGAVVTDDKGKPVMETKLATLSKNENDKQFTFKTATKTYIINDNPNGKVNIPEELNQQINQGEMTNKIGVPQLMPMAVDFNYTDLNGNKQSRTEQWMIKIPIITTQNEKGFILLPKDAINGDGTTVDVIQQYVNNVAGSMSTIMNGKLGWESVGQVYKDNGVAFDPQDHDIAMPGGTFYSQKYGQQYNK